MSGDLAVASTTYLQDKLAVARQYAAIFTAFTLPFSTSGEAIGVSIFAVLALLTLDRERFVATLRRPAAYLPVALFTLVLIGVTWSMQPSWAGAFKWVGPYVKLLLIPLVMATAFTPKQALQIGCGFLASCVIVLVLSYTMLLWSNGPWLGIKSPGIPFKDNAVQSECFGLCAFGLAVGALRMWTQGDRRRATAQAILALLFFTNIFMIYVSKTGMLVTGALLGLVLIQMNGWRRVALIGVPAIVVIGLALGLSAPAQKRLAEISVDVHASNGTPESLSTASRIDFWTKAREFVREAPVFGHGTGSIKPLYQSLEATRPSPYGQAVPDPHNQFLHIVLQVGLVGGVILLAMWAVHFRMFLGRDMASAIGLAVVMQNFLGSLFNSHISQVTQGMLYCLAVGLLGSVVLHARKPLPASEAAAQPPVA